MAEMRHCSCKVGPDGTGGADVGRVECILSCLSRASGALSLGAVCSALSWELSLDCGCDPRWIRAGVRSLSAAVVVGRSSGLVAAAGGGAGVVGVGKSIGFGIGMWMASA